MNTLEKKDKILILCVYGFLSVFLAVSNIRYTSLIFFAALGIIVYFSDKIFADKKTSYVFAAASFSVAVGYNVFYKLYLEAHGIPETLKITAAVLIFILSSFFIADEKLTVCLPSPIILYFLSPRLSFACSVMLLCYSIIRLKIDRKNRGINIFSLIWLALCTFVISAIIISNDIKGIQENFEGFFLYYENTVALIAVAIYSVIKCMRAKISCKPEIITAIIFSVAAAVVGVLCFGYSFIPLELISFCIVLLSLITGTSQITASVKADYKTHKYIFLAVAVLLLI